MGFLTPNATGELDVLKTHALQQLAQLRTTVHGLSDQQAHSTPTASTLNLTGLLKHCGMVAVFWSYAAAAAPGQPDLPTDLGEDQSTEETAAERKPLSEVLEHFDRCVGYTSKAFDRVSDLAAPVPVPVAPWFPAELKSWEARWALLHISTEIARHVGHADIIRESIDGKGSYELNDAADAAS